MERSAEEIPQEFYFEALKASTWLKQDEDSDMVEKKKSSLVNCNQNVNILATYHKLDNDLRKDLDFP